MNSKELWVGLVLLVLLVFSIAFLPLKDVSSKDVLKEMGRLAELNQQRNLTSLDLANLRLLAGKNPAVIDELTEVEFFALHNESVHVDHALSQVYFAFLGETYLCPLDDLSHVSVYLRYGENQRAAESLEEARRKWGKWLYKVENVKKRFPSTYPDLVTMRGKATMVFEATDLFSVENELNYIERNGFC